MPEVMDCEVDWVRVMVPQAPVGATTVGRSGFGTSKVELENDWANASGALKAVAASTKAMALIGFGMI